MQKVFGSSPFGYVYHFTDEERADIWQCISTGVTLKDVAERYEVSPSVIKRVFTEMLR